jgi:predicted nucleic acid-binding protein
VPVVPRRSVFIDTSFILALENRDDPLHTRAKLVDRELAGSRADCVLHWGILIEVGDGYSRLGRRAKGFQILDRFQQEDGYDIQPISPDLFEEALALYRGRHDKEWGLTDCISFILMRRLRISDAISSDVHFRQAGFNAVLLD